MDNKSIIIIILAVLLVICIFAGVFIFMGSNNNQEDTVVANDTSSDVSDVSQGKVSEVKNATVSSNSNEPKKYEDWQKDYDTGMVDEDGNPIYRSVVSTSGGQNDPGVYESYWSENGPINETKIG